MAFAPPYHLWLTWILFFFIHPSPIVFATLWSIDCMAVQWELYSQASKPVTAGAAWEGQVSDWEEKCDRWAAGWSLLLQSNWSTSQGCGTAKNWKWPGLWCNIGWRSGIIYILFCWQIYWYIVIVKFCLVVIIIQIHFFWAKTNLLFGSLNCQNPVKLNVV